MEVFSQRIELVVIIYMIPEYILLILLNPD